MAVADAFDSPAQELAALEVETGDREPRQVRALASDPGEEGHHVYLVEAGGKPTKRTVTVGKVVGGRSEIVEGLKEGDEIEIAVDSDHRFNLRRKPDPEAILARLRAFRGRLPAGFRFDRDEANARGA